MHLMTVLFVYDSDQIELTKRFLKPQKKSKFDARKVIQDDGFWRRERDLLYRYNPIRISLVKMQGQSVNLADVFYVYDKLVEEYENEQSDRYDERVGEILRNRYSLIEDDMHCAAFLADPRYLQEEYDTETYERAMKYVNVSYLYVQSVFEYVLRIHFSNLNNDSYFKMIFGEDEWHEVYFELFTEFRNGRGIHAHCRALNHRDHTMMQSVDYWKLLSKNKVYSAFAAQMESICKANGTNSSTERSFNKLKYYQTRLRGSMGPRTLDDLVYCGVNMMFLGNRVYEYYGIPLELYQKRKYVKKNKAHWNGKNVNNINDNDENDETDNSEYETSEGDEEYDCDYDSDGDNEQKKDESSADESGYEWEDGYESELKVNDSNFAADKPANNNKCEYEMDIDCGSSDDDDDENRPIIDFHPAHAFKGSAFDMD